MDSWTDNEQVGIECNQVWDVWGVSRIVGTDILEEELSAKLNL